MNIAFGRLKVDMKNNRWVKDDISTREK